MSILRIWRGATAVGRAEDYAVYIRGTGLRDYQSTPGNRGALMLRRDDGDLARFTTLSLWGSIDDVRAFAGEDLERARFYPEDDVFLVERGETVEHHEVVGEVALGGALVDHAALYVTDVLAARPFYDAALAPLGIEVMYRGEDGALAYGRDDRDDFGLHPAAEPTRGAHLAFAARSEDEVRAFHAAAVAAGGRDNGPPGLRPHYHRGYFAAYVLDPNGNNLEAVVHRR